MRYRIPKRAKLQLRTIVIQYSSSSFLYLSCVLDITVSAPWLTKLPTVSPIAENCAGFSCQRWKIKAPMAIQKIALNMVLPPLVIVLIMLSINQFWILNYSSVNPIFHEFHCFFIASSINFCNNISAFFKNTLILFFVFLVYSFFNFTRPCIFYHISLPILRGVVEQRESSRVTLLGCFKNVFPVFSNITE